MKTNFTRMKTLLAAFLMGAASMNAWGQEAETLYEGDFTSLSTFSYTQNHEFSLNGADWRISTGQYNGGVFYLGVNKGTTDASKGSWNYLDESWADVKAAAGLGDEDVAYAMETSYAFASVSTLTFAWDGNNNVFQVSLYADTGSGLTQLGETVEAANGTAAAGTISYAFEEPTDVSKVVLVAQPANAGKTLRMASFTVTGIPSSVSDPAFSLPAGTYFGTQSVTLTQAEGAEIYYTTDGSDPMAGGTLYAAPIEVPSSMTIKAVAKSGDEYSAVVTAEYIIKQLTADLPYRIDFNEASGLGDWLMTTNNNSVQWSIAGDYAEINGFGQNSEVWFVSPQVSSPTTSYVLNFESGAYFSGTPLELYYATDYDVESGEATWQEITDAAAWATSDTWVASGDVKVTSEQPIRFAFKYTSTSSNAMRWRLRNLSIVEGEAPSAITAPEISFPAGTYFGTQNVTLTHAEGLEIYYTTDGNDPRESGTLYENAIEVAASMTLKAAAKSGDEYSDVVTAEYTIKQLTAELPYSIAFNETTGLGDWIVTSNNDLVTWTIDEYNGTEYANINAYGKGASEVWLISPEVSSTTGSYALNFLNAINFSGGSFELYYAADYDVEKGASEATWSNITDQAAWSTGGYAWTESGEVLVMSDQPIRFAFKYVSEADAAMGCEIRDLSIAEGAEPVQPEEALPLDPPYEISFIENLDGWTTKLTDSAYSPDNYKWTSSADGATLDGYGWNGEAWLISPLVVSSNGVYAFSFESLQATQYGGSTMHVYYTAGYDVNNEPVLSEWTEIEGVVWSTNSWVPSGELTVSSDQPIRFAFVMDNMNGDEWFLKNVVIKEGAEPIEVAAPTFSVEAGQVPQGTVVELACETEGAAIYYTINSGAETEYTEPIVLDEVGYMDITAWAELEGVESSTTMMSYEVYAVVTESKVITVQPKGTDTWVAMSTTFNEREFEGVPVTVGADGGVEQAAGLLWTLVYNEDKTQVALRSADGQYVAYGTSGTELRMQADIYMWNVTDNGDGSCMLEATTGSDRALAYRTSSNVFRSYAQSNASQDEYQFAIYLRDESKGSGINDLAAEGMRVYSDGGTLFITVGDAQDVQVYGIDGRMVRNLQLEEGTNAVNGLAQGIYVVNNQKVVVK